MILTLRGNHEPDNHQGNSITFILFRYNQNLLVLTTVRCLQNTAFIAGGLTPPFFYYKARKDRILDSLFLCRFHSASQKLLCCSLKKLQSKCTEYLSLGKDKTAFKKASEIHSCANLGVHSKTVSLSYKSVSLKGMENIKHAQTELVFCSKFK